MSTINPDGDPEAHDRAQALAQEQSQNESTVAKNDLTTKAVCPSLGRSAELSNWLLRDLSYHDYRRMVLGEEREGTRPSFAEMQNMMVVNTRNPQVPLVGDSFHQNQPAQVPCGSYRSSAPWTTHQQHQDQQPPRSVASAGQGHTSPGAVGTQPPARTFPQHGIIPVPRVQQMPPQNLPTGHPFDSSPQILITEAELHALLTLAYGRLQSQVVPRPQSQAPVPRGWHANRAVPFNHGGPQYPHQQQHPVQNARLPDAMLGPLIPLPPLQSYGGHNRPPPPPLETHRYDAANGGVGPGSYSIPSPVPTATQVNAVHLPTPVDSSPSTPSESQSWNGPMVGNDIDGVALEVPHDLVEFNVNIAERGWEEYQALDELFNQPQEEEEEALEDDGYATIGSESGSTFTTPAPTPAVNAMPFSMGAGSSYQAPPAVAHLQESPIQFENLGPSDFAGELAKRWQ